MTNKKSAKTSELSDISKGVVLTEYDMEKRHSQDSDKSNKVTVHDEPVDSHSPNQTSETSTEGDTNNGSKKKKPKLLVPVIICLAISFGGYILGWDIGTIGGITTMPSFKNHFGTITSSDINGNSVKAFKDIEVGLIISVFNISCAFGGLTLAKVGDWKGRKWGIASATMLYAVGVLIQIVKDNNWIQFLIGRVVSGFAIGSNAVLIPIYLSESAPVSIRGAMVCLYQIMITLGILVGNIVNYGCVHRNNSDNDNNSWIIPIALGLVWAALVLLPLVFIPESAPFLGSVKFRLSEAGKSYSRMNGISVTDKETTEFCTEMTMKHFENIEKRTEKKYSIFSFATGKPRLGLRLFIGVMIMAFQQLSGINYFFYYSTLLFKNAGVNDPYCAAIILSTINFIATFGGIYLVEKWGRKMCLLLGSLGMFVCMMLYASLGSFLLNYNGTSEGMIAVTCIYIVIFAITLGPVTFVLVAELFPMRTRALSMAICSSVNWLINFLISLLTPIITSGIGFYYGYIFAGCLLASALFVWTLVPETKGKNDNAIDAIYENKEIGINDSEDIENVSHIK